MARVTTALFHLIFSLTLVIITQQIPTHNCAQAQENLVVQPASGDITLTGNTRSQTTVTLPSNN